MTITLEHMYWLTGLLLFVFAFLTLKDNAHQHRLGTAAFWGLYGLTFCFGKMVPGWVTGLAVVAMTVLATLKLLSTGDYHSSTPEAKKASADRYGNKLLLPTLVIPLVIFLVVVFTKMGALVGLGLGAIASLIAAFLLTHDSLGVAMDEGRRLTDAVSWAIILPQFLAALGALFAKAGVGNVVADLVTAHVPVDSKLAVIIAYCLGMALFTIIMGNAFAAFAVITSGIGIPLVVQQYGADPAIVGVLGMLAGYCGTLVTPMAANFNLVPSALLEISDRYGVIKAQLPLAVTMLCVQIALMYFLAF